jgi:two-component system, cell cycle sensor histidine kinase and response regulator CckA
MVTTISGMTHCHMNLDSENNKLESKNITLSNSLRNRLIFTVSFIFIFTMFTNFWFSSHRAKVLNSEKASEYLLYLRDNLEVPLWNMDNDWVESICKSFANNEMIGFLKVTDGDDNILFQKANSKEQGIEIKRIELNCRKYYVGSIELGLSGQLYKRQNQKMLLINILTMALVILGLALSTKFILNTILEKPLSHLLKKINDISRGEYDDTSQQFKHFEVITILEKFNHMSSEVKKREISLIETNKQLELEIATRKKIEEAHKDSEKRYSQLVENLTVGVFRSSPKRDGSFLMVNKAMLNMLGYQDKDQFLAKSVSSIYKNPQMRTQLLGMLLKQGKIQGFECEFVKKDGTTLIGLTSSQISFDSEGNPLYNDGIIEDITHRKHLEKQIKQTQKMEALGTLAGGIAHDFNNILSSVFGFTEVAKLRYASGKEMNDSLDEILNAGIRARGLIKQIMTFSHRSEVKQIAMNINPILKETVKFLRASLPAMIEISYDNKGKENFIWGDPTQIHQILMNLCTNSAHAMVHGGILEINLDDIRIHEQSKPLFQGLKSGDYICLQVRDTGHGIKSDHLERLFEPFFTTKPRGEGTGMGLAVVHGIVTKMGGDVFVESIWGTGSCFSVLIPKFQGEIIDSGLNYQSFKTGKGGILFVDDEIGFLKSGTEILSEHGYDVISATSGQQAIEIIQSDRQRFDLIVTDMIMPKMTGLEMAIRIKEIRRGIPIILCTGFSTDIDKKTRQDAGIDEVVLKPILSNELIDAIERVMNPRRG